MRRGTTPTLEITVNGTYNVTGLASIVANIAGGGGDLPTGISKVACGTYTVASDFTTLHPQHFRLHRIPHPIIGGVDILINGLQSSLLKRNTYLHTAQIAPPVV